MPPFAFCFHHKLWCLSLLGLSLHLGFPTLAHVMVWFIHQSKFDILSCINLAFCRTTGVALAWESHLVSILNLHITLHLTSLMMPPPSLWEHSIPLLSLPRLPSLIPKTTLGHKPCSVLTPTNSLKPWQLSLPLLSVTIMHGS